MVGLCQRSLVPLKSNPLKRQETGNSCQIVLSEKWADEKFRYEDCWFIYPQTNKVLKITEVEMMYGIDDYISFLREAEFIDIKIANDIMGDEPAQEGEYFAFWCRKPKA